MIQQTLDVETVMATCFILAAASNAMPRPDERAILKEALVAVGVYSCSLVHLAKNEVVRLLAGLRDMYFPAKAGAAPMGWTPCRGWELPQTFKIAPEASQSLLEAPSKPRGSAFRSKKPPS